MTSDPHLPGAARPAARNYEIVGLASSAGGVTGLSRVLSGLPAGFPVPVVIVQHLDPRHQTVIADVLGRRCKLKVQLADEGDELKPGVVYIAPPNHHLLLGSWGHLTLSSSELVHFVRPSADLLFESMAGAYGRAAIACVLTGTGSDGAMGVEAVKARGGTVLSQDPATSEFKGMPEAAIATGVVDFVLPLDEIAGVIVGLVEERSPA